MAVSGERIVAVCEDNTVNVYDAVTGVPKSSLNPPQRVTKVESSLDGSILSFAHKRAREITMWDTQTGGLVHTFAAMSDINDIAVSSEGRYVGSCSSDGTFEFWEVERRCRGSFSLGQAIASIHWLEPESQVALVLEGVVVILEVITRMMLHRYSLGGRVRGLTFFPHLHQFAVVVGREIRNRVRTIETTETIKTIDIRTGALQSSPTPFPKDVSHFTLSDDGSQLIYATNTGHLRSSKLGYLHTQNDHVNHLGTIHSMSLLRSGHLVVNSGGSIQILGLEYTRRSKAPRDPEITHVYQLDSDKTICGSSRDHTDAYLLDMETLANYHIGLAGLSASPTLRLLCASINEDIAFLSFRKNNGFALRGGVIGGTSLWEVPSSRPVLLGALSPDGWRLIVVSGGEDPSGGGDWELSVLEARSGKVSNGTRFIQKGRPPSKIRFTSERQFYTEERQVLSTLPRDENMSDCEDNHEDEDDCKDHHVQTMSTLSNMTKNPSLHPQQLDVTLRTTMSTSTTNSEGQPHTGVCHKEYRVRKTFSLKTAGSDLEVEEVSRDVTLTTNRYALDDSLEWVVDAKSRKVCWLPPGYVTGIKDGHFFVGSSIVTAGKDGVVRKLTFREPGSDS